MADWRSNWEFSGWREHSAERITHSGTPFFVPLPRLMIFGKEETDIDVCSEALTDHDGEEAKNDGEETLPKPGPEESIYSRGCKPRVVYIELPKPLEEDSSIFGYISDSVSPETELVMTEVEQETTASQSRSSQTRHAKLHRKCYPQTDDTKSKMKLWCFSCRPEAKGKGTGTLKNTGDNSTTQEAAIRQSMITLGGKVQRCLEEHFSRISEVQSRLGIVLEEMPKEQHEKREANLSEEEEVKEESYPLNVDYYEEVSGRLIREKQALEDKEEELKRQTLEFLLRLKGEFDDPGSRSRMEHVLSLECRRLRDALPIYARRSAIVRAVRENQVTVLVGETGCGKSTQMPQYLLEAGLADGGKIVCTQPRKVAAVSLASRVAEEMDVTLGEAVGFHVGRSMRMRGATRLSYVTDHILLTESLRDWELSSFSCVIVDEAHERNVYSDLLLGMIKKCLRRRPGLRVVVASATVDPEVFVRYFGGCPALHVSGRHFPVEVEWVGPKAGDDPSSSYERRAVERTVKVHKSEKEGDILVFLPTPAEVQRCCRTFDDYAREDPKTYVTVQLHGKMQKHEQLRVLDPTPGGERKVIFSTNSGETSLTIPTVKFVIDTGFVKHVKFDDTSKMNVHSIDLISQSRAVQRMGRAGRVCPGKCIRLYTKKVYEKMDAYTLPEIMRCDIGLSLLRLMDLDVDPLRFDYVTAPSKEAMDEAYATLVSIGAVAGNKITHLGRCIAKLNLAPKFGALVYEGHRKGVVSEAIVIASASTVPSIFLTCENGLTTQKQIELYHPLGDHLTNLSVFRAWLKVKEESKSDWCLEHSINPKLMVEIHKHVQDTIQILRCRCKINVSFSLSEDAEADALVASILVMVSSRYLSYSISSLNSYCMACKKVKVKLLHYCVTRSLDPSPEWIVFDNITKISNIGYARNVTPVAEELLVKGLREGWLPPEIDEIRRTRVSLVCEVYAGEQIGEFFNSKSEHLNRFLSFMESKSPGNEAVVRANENRGVIQVLAREWSRPHLSGCLRKTVDLLKEKLQREKSLECVGSRRNCVGAVIGAGGITTNILMPDECRVVIIRCPENSEVDAMSEKKVLKAFGHFGEIEDCQRFIQTEKSSTTWGFVVYKNTVSALRAIRETKDSSEGIAEPNGVSCFAKKVHWDRDPVVDSGYITFSKKKYALKAESYNFTMCTSFKRARLANHEMENTLRILHLGQLVPEETFREELARALNISPVLDILEIRMPKENPKKSEKKDKSLMRRLLTQMEQLKGADLFHLYFRKPQEGDTCLSAFCVHHNPNAPVSWKEVNKHLLLKEQVYEEAIYDSSICIFKPFLTEHKDELGKQIKELESKGVMTAQKHREKDVIMYLEAEDVLVLAEANDTIQRTIAGQVVECRHYPQSKLLFSEVGKYILMCVMLDTGTLILTDDRLMTLIIHGSDSCRESARKGIIEKMLEYSSNALDIDLKGPGKPPGLMNYLISEFGIHFAGFKVEADLDSISLDLRHKVLRVSGQIASINVAKNLVDRFGRMLKDETTLHTFIMDWPECVSCSHPTRTREIYRLECGHGYCKLCLKAFLHHAIVNQEFPMTCTVRACETPLEWRDIETLADYGYLSIQSLVAASVSSFVARNWESFRYCITPFCPSVYRVTETGEPFACPECTTRICTSCHTYYHSGLTCAQHETFLLSEEEGETD